VKTTKIIRPKPVITDAQPCPIFGLKFDLVLVPVFMILILRYFIGLVMIMIKSFPKLGLLKKN